jgi:hypothetical protein
MHYLMVACCLQQVCCVTGSISYGYGLARMCWNVWINTNTNTNTIQITTQCSVRLKHIMVAGNLLIVSMLSSVIIFMKNYYLEHLLKTRILYFLNIGSYGWTVRGAWITVSSTDIFLFLLFPPIINDNYLEETQNTLNTNLVSQWWWNISIASDFEKYCGLYRFVYIDTWRHIITL